MRPVCSPRAGRIPSPILTRMSGNSQAGARGVRPESPRMRKLLVGVLALALAVPAGVAMAAPGGKAATAGDYLDQLVKRSPGPEYRRYGTAAMADVADWAAGRLAHAKYHVVRDDEATANRWAVDYTAGHQPLLTSGAQSY